MNKSSVFAAFFVFLALISKQVNAQNPSSYYEEDPRTFMAGAILGANFTQVDGDNYAGYNKIGFNAGGIVYTNLLPNFAASIEILYSQKGSRSTKVQGSNSNTYTVEKYNIQLDYAEIPLQLNYFDKRKSHFGGGISLSRLINYRENVVAKPEVTFIKDYPFRKMDYQFILGGSLHLWQGFFLQARFQYSLLPARKEIHPEFGRPGGQYNNVWTLRIMYLF